VDSAVQSAEGSGMSFRSVVASMMRVAQVWATEGGSWWGGVECWR
jgi:hypothetical protein